MRTLHTPQPFEANPSNASAKFVSGRANKRLSQCAVSKGLARRGTASGEFATLFPRRSARSVLSAKIFAAKAATKPVESTPEASIASVANLPIFCTDHFRSAVRMKGLEPPGADSRFRSSMPGRRAACCIASPGGCLPARKGIWGISRQFIHTNPFRAPRPWRIAMAARRGLRSFVCRLSMPSDAHNRFRLPGSPANRAGGATPGAIHPQPARRLRAQRSLSPLSGFFPTTPPVISLPVRLILFQMADRRPVEANA